MEKICAFFGHREVWRDISAPLELAVRRAVAEGCTVFWCGGRGNFDTYAAQTVVRLKKEFPHIRLLLVLAYLSGKEKPLEMYDATIYPEGLEMVPPRFAIGRRNQWMAKHCDLAITFVDHPYGGAYAAYRVVKAGGKVLENLGELVT